MNITQRAVTVCGIGAAVKHNDHPVGLSVAGPRGRERRNGG